MNRKYFVVFDKNGILFGAGLSKRTARKDAWYWHKNQGPALLPLGKARECSKEVYVGLPGFLGECVTVKGILQYKETKVTIKKVKVGNPSLSQFKKLGNGDKLDIIYAHLLRRT